MKLEQSYCNEFLIENIISDYYSMNNYAILLEQFHLYEQQQSVTHEQFTEIIDYIRNERQNKHMLIIRKKEQKTLLTHRQNRHQERHSQSIPKINTTFNEAEQSQNLQQINHMILKKEYQELEIQVNKVRKQVKQMEDKLAVYARKDNQIKQLKYSSKRELENSHLALKNQRMQITQLQQKHYRLIQQLTTQKSNLEHENRFLAEQLNSIKFLTKSYMKSGALFETIGNSPQVFVIEQLYTKKKLQQHLRCLHILFIFKKHWNGVMSSKSFTEILQQSKEILQPTQYFSFLSKSETLNNYLQHFSQKSFISITIIVLELYRSLSKNIGKLQNINNHLNTKLAQLRQQNQRLDSTLKQIKGDHAKIGDLLVKQYQGILGQTAKEVIVKCRTVFQSVEKWFRLAQKFRNLIATLDSVIQHKVQNKNETKTTNMYSSSHFRKKIQTVSRQKDKRTSNLSSSINLTKKSSSSQVQPTATTRSASIHPSKLQGIMAQYQSILFRNPKQVIFQWYETLKPLTESSTKFLQSLLNNDLFRIFFQPQDYNPNLNQLQNQAQCTKKIFDIVDRLLHGVRGNLEQSLQWMYHAIQEITMKNNGNNINSSNMAMMMNSSAMSNWNKYNNNNGNNSFSDGQVQAKYVIQSKGYFRRDNFKLLEKLELIQMKQKGLYVPYRYGVDVQNELLTQKPTKKQLKLQSLQKITNLRHHHHDRSSTLSSRRQPRNTAPDCSNYISTYRQRINKADKKIRDLLQNADNLRFKKTTTSIKDRSSRYSQRKNKENNNNDMGLLDRACRKSRERLLDQEFINNISSLK